MPYDLFVTTAPAPPEGELEADSTVWTWGGSWPTLWLAQQACDRLAQDPVLYRRWRLFRSRRRTSVRADLHLEGTFQ